jgi:4,5-DOPA dioxygenase extradiol
VTAFPSVFVSHGAPTLALEDGAAHQFLRGYGEVLGRPRAIVVASAHWTTAAPAVCAATTPKTIHDFSGFPRALYQLSYPAPGAPELAQQATGLLAKAGIDSALDEGWGLDHGAWVPLMLMYPAADIPVLQIALQPHLGTAHHYALGRALAPLRDDGVLILGSGGATHNLRQLGSPDTPPPAWASDFSAWLYDTIGAGQTEALLNYRALAPQAKQNHPTEEHFLPLFVAAGAAASPRGRRVHTSTTYGSLMMDAYAFD